MTDDEYSVDPHELLRVDQDIVQAVMDFVGGVHAVARKENVNPDMLLTWACSKVLGGMHARIEMPELVGHVIRMMLAHEALRESGAAGHIKARFDGVPAGEQS